MSTETRIYFSEVTKLVRLLLVCPAASVERSFSALRRLMTWLRSSMSQERLNDAAMCKIHQNILDDVDVRQLLKELVTRNGMRVTLFGNFI